MRNSYLIPVLLITGGLAFAQHRQGKSVEKAQVASAAQLGTVEFHNADVTVRNLHIPLSGSESVPADIHDYLLISYGNNSLRVTGYQTDFGLNFADGDIQVLQGGWPHTLNNASTHPAELVMVEVARNLFPKSARCGLGAKDCGETRYGQSGAGEYRQTTLFETDTANLYRVALGGQVAMHQHDDTRPHLIIALTSFQGHADAESFALRPGQVFWHDGSINEIANDGAAQARFLILELKEKY